jgi:hypothetical protein
MLEALHLWHMGVPVHKRIAVLEAGGEPSLPPQAWSCVVDDPDPYSLDLDDVLFRQGLLQLRLVHVPVDALDRRPERAQFLQEPNGHEVAAVQNELRALDQADALVRQRARAAREMRVRDDRDAGQETATGSLATAPGSWRKRPAFHMSSPSA